VEVLKDPDIVKQLGNILKTNVRACKSLGHPYMQQVCFTVTGLREHQWLAVKVSNYVCG